MPIAHAQSEGITINPDCLDTGTCSWNMYQTLGIREDTNPDTNNFETLTKDVFLSGTFFIGTVVTVALVVSGMMIVFAGADEGLAAKGKDGIKYSLIGLVLVLFSFSIIRIVQFIAQGQQ